MTKTRTKRLTISDWQQAGFAALASAGPEALKAEPLARRLGTTKGSFYWHFSDVPAFHASLLTAWEGQANAEIDTALAQETTAVARLRRLAQVMADKDNSLATESSIRAWAQSHDLAARTLTRVDHKRLTYLQELLTETGISNPEMARIIYATSIGMEQLGQPDPDQNTQAMGSLVDLVLALR